MSYRKEVAPGECLAFYADRVGLRINYENKSAGFSYQREFRRGGGATATVRGYAPTICAAIVEARPEIDRMFREGWE